MTILRIDSSIRGADSAPSKMQAAVVAGQSDLCTESA